MSIAHRDLKLDNIVISNDLETVKIIDFGLCVDINLSKQDLCMQFCGTLPYMAPEMLRKQEYNPKKADIWALGVILYRLLFEKYPYRGRTERDLL